MDILLVEDDVIARDALASLLRDEGWDVAAASSVSEANQLLARDRASLCITDLTLPDADGIEVLTTCRAAEPPIDCVVLTGDSTVERAVEAMKAGAFDYLTKPLKLPQLRNLLRRVRPSEPTTDGNRERLGSLVGRSSPMQDVFRWIERAARSNAPVMITGESGTGKEAAAWTIHELSRRASTSFVAVNTGAVTPSLFESEFFGHEKGAFTGADRRRHGYFQLAHGGTLFLDEVTEMSPELQVKFLRVLETRTFRRVGGGEEIDVDVRLISSSNRDLRKAVMDNQLREDLYYRLNVLPVHLPGLRERLDDIPLLAEHFLREIEGGEKAGVTGFDDTAVSVLQSHRWPGNVRELRNTVYRAYVLADPPSISAADVRAVLDAAHKQEAPAANTEGYLPIRVGHTLGEAERILLEKTLEHTGGNKRESARLLGVSLKTIYNKLKVYGLG